MLFDDDRKLMTKQFGVPIVNEYGASELDLIAFENPKGEWQIDSETLYVKILNDDNEVLPYGSEGRIVVTSLYNKEFPMIRYDIGDTRLGLPILYFGGGEGETIIQTFDLGIVAEAGNYHNLNSVINSLDAANFSEDTKLKIQKTAIESFDASIQLKKLQNII